MTIRGVVPEIPPHEAEIVVVPVVMVVARPVTFIAATWEFDDVQVAAAVKSWVVLSEKVPVALNC